MPPITGCAYYPEHWPAERWATDAGLMQQAGLSVVRLAEFAWDKMEPQPGVYDFDWLQQASPVLMADSLWARWWSLYYASAGIQFAWVPTTARSSLRAYGFRT